MKKRVLIISAILLALSPSLRAQDNTGIIPPAKNMTLERGSFKMSGSTVKLDAAFDPVADAAIRKFASRLSLVSGRTSAVSAPVGLAASVASGSIKGVVFLLDHSLGPGEYSIAIDSKTALVRAGDTDGLLYSLQTLRCLLPESIYEATAGDKPMKVPCCTIADKPGRAVRAISIDCASEWAAPDRLKALMENMAAVKLNRLQLLLSDNDCWRAETESHPTLAQITRYRKGDTYSQGDISSLVKYAKSLGISLVPMIETPRDLLTEMGLGEMPASVLDELTQTFGEAVVRVEEFDPQAEDVFKAGATRADLARYATLLWTE